MLIGISGKMKAGKDTSADFLSYLFTCYNQNWLEHMTYKDYVEDFPYGLGFEKHRFADAMKECLAICLNVPRYFFEDQEYKESSIPWLNGMTVRELLQKFGTSIRYNVSQDFWVKVLLQRFKDAPEPTNWIIPDVRFYNEVESIKQQSGIVIRINRPNYFDLSEHISENALDNWEGWDYIINNNSSLEELFNRCKEICLDIVSK